MNKPFSFIFSLALMFTVTNTAVLAQSDALMELGKNVIPKWVNDNAVISAIKTQNEKHNGLSEAEIIAKDKQWRAETSNSNQPMIKDILGNSLSSYLAKIKNDSAGVYTEVFVMDNKGMNVGQSDVTSDYWQGDEAKWQKTFLVGADAIHVGDIEVDESSQQLQSQVSVSVIDPENGNVIGAVTVGVNVDAL